MKLPGESARPAALVLLLGATLASAPTNHRTGVLRRVADAPLPGPAVRFDYQSLDTTSDLLYLSHMNAGALLVFDLRADSVEARIEDLPRITGVLAIPALGKVYASVPGHHQVAIIDAHDFHVVARVGEVGFPDGIAYAPDVKKVYVSDESGGGELVIDGTSDRVLAKVPIGGEAGNSIYDSGSRRVLVAVQDRNEIIAIDPRVDRVVARYKLRGAARPHGMCLDPARHLLFVANEANATLLVADLRTMKVLESHPVGEDPDVLAFDPALGRLYVASESGVVSVFTRLGARLVCEEDLKLAHAHTVSVDARTHRVYLPLQDLGGRPTLRIMEGH